MYRTSYVIITDFTSMSYGESRNIFTALGIRYNLQVAVYLQCKRATQYCSTYIQHTVCELHRDRAAQKHQWSYC